MQAIFPILRQEDNNIYIFEGNGFFVNKKGSFATAGHVFKKQDRYVIGIKNNDNNFQLIPVLIYKNLYKEDYYRIRGSYEQGHIREKIRHQYGPEWRDVGVGITIYRSSKILTFKVKKPRNKNIVHVNYYKRNDSFPRAGLEINNGILEGGHLSQVSIEIEIINQNQSVNHPFMGFNHNPERPDHKNKYSNCIWGKNNTEPGASGSPVLNDNGKVIGIIIGGYTPPDNVSFILLAKYIQKRSMSLLYNLKV